MLFLFAQLLKTFLTMNSGCFYVSVGYKNCRLNVHMQYKIHRVPLTMSHITWLPYKVASALMLLMLLVFQREQGCYVVEAGI